MELHDLHLTFSKSAERLKAFAAGGHEVFACEARNRTLNPGEGHFGHVPTGEFKLGSPVVKNTIPFGPYFVPVLDYGNHHAMRDFHREGIGLHGGGSGLKHPFAPRQGWVVTEGCVRVQNEDLEHLVLLIRAAQAAGAECLLTVTD